MGRSSIARDRAEGGEQRAASASTGASIAPPASGIGFVDGGHIQAGSAQRGAVVQRAAGERTGAGESRSPRTTGLPAGLKAGVEGLSGVRMDDVRVHHDSPRPARIGALAFARGSEIHVGPGQGEHLPHEAWHVVQQKQGRVKPTTQLRGESMNTDSALEREADAMGARAARWSGPRGDQAARGEPATSRDVVQRLPAPVIQARKVLLATGAAGPQLLPSDQYTEEVGQDGVTRRYVEIDLKKYEHIVPAALDAYEAAVRDDPNQTGLPSEVYETLQPGYTAYRFSSLESAALYSIHITQGGRIVTMTPRNPNPLAKATTAAQNILRRGGNEKMNELDAQHVSTHMPGTPAGGTHRHYFNPNRPFPQDVLNSLIDRLEEKGIIGVPRVDASGNELEEDELETGSMDESEDVASRLRATFGIS